MADLIIDVDEAAFRPPFTIEALVARFGERRAVELVNDGVEVLLLRGQLEYALRELRTSAAERLAEREDGIVPAVLKVSAVLAYSMPDEAGALLDLLPFAYDAPEWLDHQTFLALTFAAAFETAGGSGLPEPLLRVVTLGPVVEGPEAIGLLEEGLALCRRQPGELCSWLDPLPRELLNGVGQAVGQAGRLLAVDEHESLLEPGSTATPALEEVLSLADRCMDRDRGSLYWSVALLVALLVGFAAWWSFGWPGAAAGAALFLLAGALPAQPVDRRLYASCLRVPLVRYALHTGASPAALSRALRRWSLTSSVRRFTSEVESDPVLLFASRLVTAVRQRRPHG